MWCVCFGSGEDDRGCGCFMPGPSEYWFDEDGDGFGSGESQEFCYDDLPLYWLDNDLDPEPSCFNTDLNTLSIDDCGICAGENADDIGCGCFNPAPLQYWYDIDEDGLGYGDSQLFCLADLPLNWVSNDIDDQPYCSTNDTDDCGVCAGANIDDLGCGCFNPGPISYWFDEDDDGFGAGESQQYCLQDVPDSWVSNNVDPEEFCSNPDPITLMIDDCGICAGENVDDLGCGCFNPGPLDYWYDVDGDGLGFGESSQYCLENIPEGWVLNNNDLEPDCFSNDTDYCNVCGGNGLDDLGCGCFNPGPLDYWYDVDGDGLGFGESSQYCLENIPEGWVLNNNDLEPNCFTNDIDSCGVCAGANINDLGCGCFEPGPIQYWFDSDGDGLGAGNYELYCEDSQPPGWVDNTNDESPDCNTNDIDDCGICAGNNTDKDCAGVCFGSAIIDDCNSCVGGDTGLEENYNDLGCGCYNPPAISYCEDTDGDGLGTEGTDTYFCLADLTDSWVANCTDPEPECFSNNTDTCGVCNGGNLDDLGCGCFELGPIQYWF